MITLRKSNERGHADHGWLNAHHSFSFGDYYDPKWMGFRTLRVLNDDRVAAGMGFNTHPHRDMEIITYVLSGELQHKDSMGNGRIIRPGEFQYMSAGSGVQHSEFNPSRNAEVHLLQTWIVPDEKGAEPRYAELSFENAPAGALHLVASKDGRNNSIAIRQDVDLWLGKLDAGDRVSHTLETGRHVWLQVAEGEITLNGEPLAAGDGAAISEEQSFKLEGVKSAQVLIFDVN